MQLHPTKLFKCWLKLVGPFPWGCIDYNYLPWYICSIPVIYSYGPPYFHTPLQLLWCLAQLIGVWQGAQLCCS